jgi:hypothetical protein
MTLFYFNNILLLSMFLVCSSCMLDIVMIYDDYIHMFVKRLIRYSSGLGGAYYVSVVLRYYMYLRMLPDVPRHVVDRRRDRSVESSIVHPLCIGYVERGHVGGDGCILIASLVDAPYDIF